MVAKEELLAKAEDVADQVSFLIIEWNWRVIMFD